MPLSPTTPVHTLMVGACCASVLLSGLFLLSQRRAVVSAGTCVGVTAVRISVVMCQPRRAAGTCGSRLLPSCSPKAARHGLAPQCPCYALSAGPGSTAALLNALACKAVSEARDIQT